MEDKLDRIAVPAVAVHMRAVHMRVAHRKVVLWEKGKHWGDSRAVYSVGILETENEWTK